MPDNLRKCSFSQQVRPVYFKQQGQYNLEQASHFTLDSDQQANCFFIHVWVRLLEQSGKVIRAIGNIILFQESSDLEFCQVLQNNVTHEFAILQLKYSVCTVGDGRRKSRHVLLQLIKKTLTRHSFYL